MWYYITKCVYKSDKKFELILRFKMRKIVLISAMADHIPQYCSYFLILFYDNVNKYVCTMYLQFNYDKNRNNLALSS